MLSFFPPSPLFSIFDQEEVPSPFASDHTAGGGLLLSWQQQAACVSRVCGDTEIVLLLFPRSQWGIFPRLGL